MTHPILMFKAIAAGLGSVGVYAALQMAGGEEVSVALEHSAGAGAFAAVAVYFVLRSRVEAQDKSIGEMERKLDDHGQTLTDIREDVATLLERTK